MTGAKPNTEWLDGCLELDDKGFIPTGYSLSPAAHSDVSVVGARPTGEFESSLPRVFAVGDVRSGSLKRVAAGVGEGSALHFAGPPRARGGGSRLSMTIRALLSTPTQYFQYLLGDQSRVR